MKISIKVFATEFYLNLPSGRVSNIGGKKDEPVQCSWYSDTLRTGRTGDRIPMWARFTAAVRTGPGIHSTSNTMGTGYLSRG